MQETEEIKLRLPIEQVIGRHISLKKAGRVYKALCPFHTEKSPSFTVNPERGIFKCFGCGEGGDIFDFTMKIEGLTFPEAVKLLAEQAGVTLPESNHNSPVEKGPSKDKLSRINNYLAKLWNTILVQHPKAEPARAYLQSRGLTQKSIEDFQIGFAPGRSATTASLQKAGFTNDELTAAGNPGRFEHRITFPITDITGRIVGFTGRILSTNSPDSNQGPKYWNTPETILYNKSRTVYGLHLAKHSIQDKDLAILAEGQMDVIMLHQFGYQNAVASSGTALTLSQIQLIGRFSTKIAFAYDQDNAGIEATKRGIDIVLSADFTPYVIVVPNGKDPADCLQQDPAAWETSYAKPQPFIEWILDQLIDRNQTLSPALKKEVARELIPWLAKLKDPVEQAEWLRILAARLQTEEQNLRTLLERVGNKEQPKFQSKIETSPDESEFPKLSIPATLTPLQKKAELCLALLITFPDIAKLTQSQIPDLKLPGSTPFIDKFFSHIPLDIPADQNIIAITQATFSVDEQKALSLYIEEVLKPYQDINLDSSQALEEAMSILQRIRSESKEDAKARLAKEIQQAQVTGDNKKLQELFSELKNMI